ncbi:MAG TPA: SDR family oxidoreductase [Burkholderiaceae bacterium]|nr:SDR family oxidoreductase [Burkholderiaceae bacterium]
MNPQPIPPYVGGHRLLAGKSALVTACAGGGIGFATAKRFAEEGVRALFMSDIHARRLDEAVARIKAETGFETIHCRVCDVTQQDQVDALVNEADDVLSGTDILFNNAGLGGQKALVEMTDGEWLRVIDVSLNGTFRMTRAMMKKMIPRGKGAIINNSSVLGWRAQKEQAHYAAAKAGVNALTRCAALEAAEHGIRINAVSPSIAMHDFLKKTADEGLLARLAEREAFGRAAEVWEMSNIVVFLASDYASYLVGEIIAASSQHA